MYVCAMRCGSGRGVSALLLLAGEEGNNKEEEEEGKGDKGCLKMQTRQPC